MNGTVEVKVHRRGNDPVRDSRPEPAHIGSDGKLYVISGNRWWMLSNGLSGWRSINVGIGHDEADHLGLPSLTR